jgi:hypothetical protein
LDNCDELDQNVDGEIAHGSIGPGAEGLLEQNQKPAAEKSVEPCV